MSGRILDPHCGYESFYDGMSRSVMRFARFARECIEKKVDSYPEIARANIDFCKHIISEYEEYYGRDKEAIGTKGIRKHVARIEKLLGAKSK